MRKYIAFVIVLIAIGVIGISIAVSESPTAAEMEPTIPPTVAAWATEVAQSEPEDPRPMSVAEDRGAVADLTQMTWEEEQAFVIDEIASFGGNGKMTFIDIHYVDINDLPQYGIPESAIGEHVGASFSSEFTYIAGFFKGPFTTVPPERTVEYMFIIINREVGSVHYISYMNPGHPQLPQLLELYPDAP